MKRAVCALAMVAVASGTAIACAQSSGGGASKSAADPLVEYHMTGGLAAVDLSVVVFDDGRAEVTSNRNPTQRFVVERSDLDDLRELLAAGHWGGASEIDDDVAADGYRYEVVYRGRRVAAADPNTPGWVIEIASRLNALALPAHVDSPIPLPE
jgi:hypothetical protein